jgi:hypothetical protein
MISKFLFLFFSILQNQEIQNATLELDQTKKIHDLSQLVTLLSIALLTVIILLCIYIYRDYKLKSEIKKLKIN